MTRKSQRGLFSALPVIVLGCRPKWRERNWRGGGPLWVRATGRGPIGAATSVIERLIEANYQHNRYSWVEVDRNFDDRGDCALNKVVLQFSKGR
jgi:hypothetical protein